MSEFLIEYIIPVAAGGTVKHIRMLHLRLSRLTVSGIISYLKLINKWDWQLEKTNKILKNNCGKFLLQVKETLTLDLTYDLTPDFQIVSWFAYWFDSCIDYLFNSWIEFLMNSCLDTRLEFLIDSLTDVRLDSVQTSKLTPSLKYDLTPDLTADMTWLLTTDLTFQIDF